MPRGVRGEENHVHPAMMKWLDLNGFTWHHEYIISTSRLRPDFVAWHKVTGEVLIVECKTNWGDIPKGIEQLLAYHQSFGNPDALMILAIPQDGYRNAQQNLLALPEQNGIQLIQLESRLSLKAYQAWHDSLYSGIHPKLIDSFIPLPPLGNQTPLTPWQLAAVFGDVDRAREIWWSEARNWEPSAQHITATGEESNVPKSS